MLRPRISAQSPNFLVEIILIVVGINVALWFEGWFDDRQDHETEKRYLVDLRSDLRLDLDQLEKLIVWAEKKSETAERIIEDLPTLAQKPADQIAGIISFPASYQFFTPSDFTYLSMQESGDFRLLSSDEVKATILRLNRKHNDIAEFQKNYLQALDDGYIPMMMNNFDLATYTLTDPSLLDSQLFRNFFAFVAGDTSLVAQHYKAALAETEKLIALIDEQLGR